MLLHVEKKVTDKIFITSRGNKPSVITAVKGKTQQVTRSMDRDGTADY